MGKNRSHHVVVVLSAVALATPLVAQTSDVTLRPASATLAHEFTRIGSVRELADGRLLIGDDDAILVADLRSGAVRRIGVSGSGPLEYRDVQSLIPLADDTTLMADASNRRLLFLHGDRIVRVTPVNDSAFALLGSALLGADARGRVLAKRQVAAPGITAPRMRNGAAFVRLDRRTMTIDTIAVGKGMEVEVSPVGPPERKSYRTMTVVLAVEDPALLFADGWIAVGRQEPYRIDWYPPTGAPRLGAPIEGDPPRVTDAEQADWRRRAEEFSGKPLPPAFATFPFAESVPPFFGDLFALPDGRVLVARHPWIGSRGTELDVVDRRGARVGRLRLPANERVVGSGRAALYVVARDEDGIERLSRRPLP
ncbi:MAG: hypothetical protein IPJ78_11340 [Gemmatimonadetes bacterium]|nr:hypothetical protein [Gemmatimonadota bacterium]